MEREKNEDNSEIASERVGNDGTIRITVYQLNQVTMLKITVSVEMHTNPLNGNNRCSHRMGLGYFQRFDNRL